VYLPIRSLLKCASDVRRAENALPTISGTSRGALILRNTVQIAVGDRLRQLASQRALDFGAAARTAQ
jgi:hypothetical protein